ncbi:MAG: hypothetical protein LC116_04140 [Bacteroidetes bacterium]|nr:hypothetical protein [Bacteroidota bacterium]MCZ2132370.1 hypothetical protein [Bacteroidota bacterium]
MGLSKFICTAVFLAFCVFGYASSQIRLYNWKAHSSMYKVVGAAYDGSGNLWAATSGGAFRYSFAKKEFTEYRNVDAMLSLGASAVYYQASSNSMFIGSNDGVISRFSLDGNKWTHLTDIQNQTTLAKKKISAFASIGGRLFVGGDFGLLEYNSENVPGDYVQQMGEFPRGTPVLQIVVLQDTLWAATPLGVARIALSEPSLRNPSAWRTINYTNGLQENNCVGIAAYGEKMYIASLSTIVEYEKGICKVIQQNAGKISTISANSDGIFYTNEFVLASVAGGGISLKLPDFPTGHVLTSAKDKENIIIFIRNNALGVYRGGDSVELVQPNTPFSNQFSSLTTDKFGNLWATTAIGDVNPAGFALLSANGWTNYRAGNNPAIVTNSFYKAVRMSDGSVWLGTWGGGIVKAVPSENGATFTNYNDSVITGLPNAPKFVVTGKAAEDANGAVWVTSFSPSSGGNLLYARSANGTWRGFENGAGSSREYKQVAVDFSGTKWLASDGAGLVVFNEKGTLDDKTDDFWRSVTTNDANILSNTQTAIAVDKNGALWLGTPVGLAVIFNPSAILRNGTLAVQRPQSLANLTINDIFVDPQNNKWVATNSGVFVLNEDGTQTLSIFTKENTPLSSNEVLAIALNETNGTMYFGTKEGLLQAQSLTVQPLPTYDVSVFPQPFYPEIDGEVVIDGLADDANIRIVSPGGQAIRSLQTKSRRITWDGRDNFGNIVPTGVYVILGVSATGGEAGAGKIAIIRK